MTLKEPQHTLMIRKNLRNAHIMNKSYIENRTSYIGGTSRQTRGVAAEFPKSHRIVFLKKLDNTAAACYPAESAWEGVLRIPPLPSRSNPGRKVFTLP